MSKEVEDSELANVAAVSAGNKPEVGYMIAEAMKKVGRQVVPYEIRVLETVVSTPGVFEVLRQLVQDFPTTTLGVGTNAKNVGAKFIMSPAVVKGILDQYSDDLLYIPGVMTPTEILSSYNAGAKIVKVYPVSAIGGVRNIATLKKHFPHIPIVASQRITIGRKTSTLADFMEACVF
ncbi:hypothetical protein L1987_00077 [Smallanthus sonchifolius]|uniref:Uncharacterized protein n=1 Tax=Smallanthus sonchifolius TaxID=185202 RepID=A0ACB9K154_9ASTR|nr:hypothetical protein L1987_00077 [Smallanthus sonchifolius]